MSPKKEVQERQEELGRPLTTQEHIDIIERRLYAMRIRFYVIVGLLIFSVIAGGTTALYVYGKAQDEAIKTTCQQANARWSRLRSNLISVALARRGDESDEAYRARRNSTLSLLNGLFNVNCEDPKQRVPVPDSTHLITPTPGVSNPGGSLP